MQSKNVLWLGLLFVILLTAFCISKYISKFHPNIETISHPQAEIIDNDIELPPVRLTDISQNYDNQQKSVDTNSVWYDEQKDELDRDYLHVIDLVEQEERDIQEAYQKALKEQEEKNLQKRAKKKEIKPHKRAKKKIKKNIAIKKPISPEDRKVIIEKVLATQKLSTYGNLTKFEKDRLQLLILHIKQNPSYNLQIETERDFGKLSQIVYFIKSLGISKKKIKVIQKKSNHIVAINPNYIELSITKKD